MAPEDKAELIEAIADAVRLRSTDVHLSAKQLEWVNMAIEREAQSIKFRNAVIEKTLSALVWALILGVGIVMLNYLRSIGLKI